MAYRDIYGEDNETEDPAQLMLLTSPLAASDEVVNIYAAGLVPVSVARPAVMHAIGASKDEIDKAVEEATKKEEERCACEEQEKGYKLEDQKLSLDERRAGLKAAPAKASVEAKQVEANVKATEATTLKTTTETKATGEKPDKDSSGSEKK